MFEYVAGQLENVRDEIAEAVADAGRPDGSVTLVAVSKTFPKEAVEAAYAAGQRVFGENRVQELSVKKPALPDDVEWHLIGHLQSNKVGQALACADAIHSVDSEKLLNRLNRLAEGNQRKPRILLEVNISGEESKFGAAVDSAMRLAKLAARCENIEFKGLMTMAPFGADSRELRGIFSATRELRDKMEAELGLKLPELSMGMSSDFRAAIMEGATLVRVGTAIFGKRFSRHSDLNANRASLLRVGATETTPFSR
ncbi:MAG: YggS family pyridoxal phosphate-dependent enzyme [Kiritimatiellaeota bacterium]|nr:YggS family pyridoxal phosphate-dependent enzyme [Kiritimatiellota bacterium]